MPIAISTDGLRRMLVCLRRSDLDRVVYTEAYITYRFERPRPYSFPIPIINYENDFFIQSRLVEC